MTSPASKMAATLSAKPAKVHLGLPKYPKPNHLLALEKVGHQDVNRHVQGLLGCRSSLQCQKPLPQTHPMTKVRSCNFIKAQT